MPTPSHPGANTRRALIAMLAGAAALSLLPATASAQARKAGLWEINQQVQMEPAQQKQLDEARKQMAAMPSAQRKQIEDMTAKQGMAMDLTSGGTKIKVCLSKEDAARDAPPVDQRPDCSYETKGSGSVQRVNYRCTKPPSQGEIEVTSVSADRYTMKMKATDTATGKSMAMQGEGRWLGAECGALKPASTLK